jgi:AraC-like DNA-binding protein
MHIINSQQFAVYAVSSGEDISGNDMSSDNRGFYKIIWAKSGSGSYNINGKKITTAASSIHCISAGVQLVFQPEAYCNAYIVLFSNKYLNESQDKSKYLSSCLLHRHFENNIILDSKQLFAHPMQDLLQLFLHESRHPGMLTTEILSKYIKLFLLYFVQQLPEANPTQDKQHRQSLAHRYLEMIEQQFARKKAVGDYAKELFVSANYLNKVVKDETGFTAREHIQQKIVAEAKRGLYLTGISMKEAAYQLGFDDIAHFSKFFKKASGHNFSDLKKTLHQRAAIV